LLQKRKISACTPEGGMGQPPSRSWKRGNFGRITNSDGGGRERSQCDTGWAREGSIFVWGGKEARHCPRKRGIWRKNALQKKEPRFQAMLVHKKGGLLHWAWKGLFRIIWEGGGKNMVFFTPQSPQGTDIVSVPCSQKEKTSRHREYTRRRRGREEKGSAKKKKGGKKKCLHRPPRAA